MKKLLLCSITFLLSCFVTAQQDEFWGTTQLGGTGNAGVIFSMNTECGAAPLYFILSKIM